MWEASRLFMISLWQNKYGWYSKQ